MLALMFLASKVTFAICMEIITQFILIDVVITAFDVIFVCLQLQVLKFFLDMMLNLDMHTYACLI